MEEDEEEKGIRDDVDSLISSHLSEKIEQLTSENERYRLKIQSLELELAMERDANAKLSVTLEEAQKPDRFNDLIVNVCSELQCTEDSILAMIVGTRSQITHLETKLASRESEIQNLRSQLTEQTELFDVEREKFKQQLAQKTADIQKQLQQKTDDLLTNTAEFSQLKAKLRQSNTQIQELQQKLTKVEAEVGEKETELMVADRMSRDYQAQIERANAEIRQLQEKPDLSEVASNCLKEVSHLCAMRAKKSNRDLFNGIQSLCDTILLNGIIANQNIDFDKLLDAIGRCGGGSIDTRKSKQFIKRVTSNVDKHMKLLDERTDRFDSTIEGMKQKIESISVTVESLQDNIQQLLEDDTAPQVVQLSAKVVELEDQLRRAQSQSSTTKPSHLRAEEVPGEQVFNDVVRRKRKTPIKFE